MRFYRIPQALRLLAVVVFSIFLTSCGSGEGPEEVVDPLFAACKTCPLGGPPPVTAPTIAAPTPPARDAADVISMFSGAYTDVVVDTWIAGFSNANLTVPDFLAAGDPTKEYTNLVFAGIETVANTIDASGMTNFSMDIWTPDDTSGGQAFNIKWVDTGPNGMVEFPSVDNLEAELVFTSPALATGSWVTIDIPLSDFTAAGLTTNTQLAQLIISGGLGTVYVDNVYFYRPPGGGGGSPELTTNGDFELGDLSGWTQGGAGGVITADNMQDSGSVWSGHVVASAGQNPFLSQANLAVGTVMPGDTIDISFDLCGSAASGGVIFPALLSEFGGGSGATRENLETISAPPASWTRYDYSATAGADVTGGVTFQLDVVCGADAGCAADAYIDNLSVTIGGGPAPGAASGLSCAGGGGPLVPAVAAPTPPARNAVDVISLFSDAYTDVTVDTWRTVWSSADLDESFVVGGSANKLYTNLDFVGIEFSSAPVDASTMTHLHLDVWTPDATSGGEVFRVKLVQFGAPNTEFEIAFSSVTTPALATGSWVSLDIPLADFTGLSGTDNLAQLILSGTLGGAPGAGTVYVDNVYFYNSAGGPVTMPPVAAPTPPARAPADVISLFSDAYTDVTVDTWRTVWSSADLDESFVVGGSANKLYTNLDFVGIEFASAPVDASAMTHLHLDVWTPDATSGGEVFRVKLVQFGAPNTEFEIAFSSVTTPALATGSWVSLDIPLADFTGLSGTDNLAQLILSGTLGGAPGAGTVYVDNVYFYKPAATSGNLAVNGDFEAGDISGWTDFSAPNNGTFAATMAQANGGLWSGNLTASVPMIGSPASFPVVKQANLGTGTVTPSTNMFISFDLFGSVSGAGGVFFAEFFSELTGGGTSSAIILSGGSIPPTGTWTTHTFTTPTGTDVSGGVTLQLKADCGGNVGCIVDAFIDNVCVSATPGICF